MVQHAQLNNIDHRDVCIRRGYSAELGNAEMACPIFPYEFRNIQPHYPIVFSKDPKSGGFRPFALFGLEEGENLFLGGDGGWDADYVPLAVRIRPFLIGFARGGAGAGTGDAGDAPQMEVHIDLDHPRVVRNSATGDAAASTGTGDAIPLFLDHGGYSPYLQEIATLLGDVDDGERTVAPFSELLDEMDLLDPFRLEVTLEDGTGGQLAGYYIIAEEALYSLDAQALEKLQTTGYLQPIYMAVAALSQFRGLIDRRNLRNRTGSPIRADHAGRAE